MPISYVYRITDLHPDGECKYYIGKRTSSFIDIGIKYFTSSRLFRRIFLSDVKRFKVKIVKTFETCKDALLFERKYLMRVDAARSPLFYNQCNSGSRWKQDRSGMTTVLNTVTGMHETVSVSEFRKHRGELYVSLSKGFGAYRKDGEFVKIPVDEALALNLHGPNYNVVHIRDEDGHIMHIDKSYYREHRDEYKHVQKGVVTCFNKKTNKFMSVTREEFYSNDDLVGSNRGIKKYKPCPVCSVDITHENFERHLQKHYERYVWIHDDINVYKTLEVDYYSKYKGLYKLVEDYRRVPFNGTFKNLRYVAKFRKNNII